MPNVKNLALAAILTLLFQRLLAALPVANSTLWMINDTARAIAFTALAAWAVSLTPWNELRYKCIAAALFGYGVADTLCCVLWYVFRWGGYWQATGLQLAGFGAALALYWGRSYQRPSDPIVSGLRVYCLRRKPKNLQDLLIAMSGWYGPHGGYAIACAGNVYSFHKGVLRAYPIGRVDLSQYHITAGGYSKPDELDKQLGLQWRLLGPNCLTILRDYWSKYGRRR